MDDKDEIIKRLIDENEYLKGLLKANNILYVCKKYVEDIKLSTNEKLSLYLEYFAFRKSPIKKFLFIMTNTIHLLFVIIFIKIIYVIR